MTDLILCASCDRQKIPFEVLRPESLKIFVLALDQLD